MWVMDSIQLMCYLLGICYVMRNCCSRCGYKEQQDLGFALKELAVRKEQNAHLDYLNIIQYLF